MAKVLNEELLLILNEKYLFHHLPTQFNKISNESLLYIYFRLLGTFDFENIVQISDKGLNFMIEYNVENSKFILRRLHLLGLSYFVSKSKDLIDKGKASRLLFALHDKITAKHGKNLSHRVRMFIKKEEILKSSHKKQPVKKVGDVSEFVSDRTSPKADKNLPIPSHNKHKFEEPFIPKGWQIPRTPLKPDISEPSTKEFVVTEAIPPPPLFCDSPRPSSDEAAVNPMVPSYDSNISQLNSECQDLLDSELGERNSLDSAPRCLSLLSSPDDHSLLVFPSRKKCTKAIEDKENEMVSLNIEDQNELGTQEFVVTEPILPPPLFCDSPNPSSDEAAMNPIVPSYVSDLPQINSECQDILDSKLGERNSLDSAPRYLSLLSSPDGDSLLIFPSRKKCTNAVEHKENETEPLNIEDQNKMKTETKLYREEILPKYDVQDSNIATVDEVIIETKNNTNKNEECKELTVNNNKINSKKSELVKQDSLPGDLRDSEQEMDNKTRATRGRRRGIKTEEEPNENDVPKKLEVRKRKVKAAKELHIEESKTNEKEKENVKQNESLKYKPLIMSEEENKTSGVNSKPVKSKTNKTLTQKATTTKASDEQISSKEIEKVSSQRIVSDVKRSKRLTNMGLSIKSGKENESQVLVDKEENKKQRNSKRKTTIENVNENEVNCKSSTEAKLNRSRSMGTVLKEVGINESRDAANDGRKSGRKNDKKNVTFSVQEKKPNSKITQRKINVLSEVNKGTQSEEQNTEIKETIKSKKSLNNSKLENEKNRTEKTESTVKNKKLQKSSKGNNLSHDFTSVESQAIKKSSLHEAMSVCRPSRRCKLAALELISEIMNDSK